MISYRRFASAAAILAFAATTAFAALSPKYADFPKGPAQWLMTGEERSAWKNVKTDADAEQFIQLFWARRDPTAGTPRNEFREEFDARVAFADKAFGSKRRRGALTDMGRVLIVLGPPKDLAASYEGGGGGASMINSTNLVNAAGGGMHGATSVDVGDRQTFEYTPARTRELGLTKEVVFIANLDTHEYMLDPRQGNVMGALALAVKRAVKNPDLATVPTWATPEALAQSQTKVVFEPAKPAAAPAAPAAADAAAATTAAPEPALAPVTEPAGVKALVLSKDVFTLAANGSTNPLTSLESEKVFARSDALGYAVQYCAGKRLENEPTLKETVTITGTAKAGGQVRLAAPEDDVTPDALSSAPGCYVVRGSIPLADMKPGSYKMTVKLTDPSTKQSYNLEREFKVE